jgi:hypothetical protein
VSLLLNRNASVIFRLARAIGKTGDNQIVFQIVDKTDEINGLRIKFDVEMGASNEPNTSSISIFNMTSTRRAFLDQVSRTDTDRKIIIQLNVGYQNTFEELITGDLKTAVTTKEGPDFVTKLEIGEEEFVYRTARLNKSYAAGTLYQTIVNDLVRSMGLKAENLLEIFGTKSATLGIQVVKGKKVLKGYVANGLSRDMLTEICRSFDVEWSVQRGKIVFSFGSEPGFVDIPVLRSGNVNGIQIVTNTGLIGAPKSTNDGVEFKSLLNTKILPKKTVRLISDQFDGFFLVRKVKHFGDTHGADWYSEAETVEQKVTA